MQNNKIKKNKRDSDKNSLIEKAETKTFKKAKTPKTTKKQIVKKIDARNSNQNVVNKKNIA